MRYDGQQVWARSVCSHPVFTGLAPHSLANLVSELAVPWEARCESARAVRRNHTRIRMTGAGPGYSLRFADRILVTLLKLRLGLPHEALGFMFGVSRHTIDRAVQEVLPLLAGRGCATPLTGPRLRTLADVFAYAETNNVVLRCDGTEIRVRRPQAHKPGRNRYVSGKARANTIKTTVMCGADGKVLWVGGTVPGRMHDQTALYHAGVRDLLEEYPRVSLVADGGYGGLGKQYLEQVWVPPKRLGKETSGEEQARFVADRREQSSERLCVEHCIAGLKHWRVLQRWTGTRKVLPDIIKAVAGLASERTVPS